MFNTLATAIAEKVRINSETEETTTGERKNVKFLLLAVVPTVLATVGGSYFLMRRRWHR